MRATYRLLVASAIFLATYLVAILIPLEWFWFDPGTPVVGDAHVGDAPAVGFTREIKRDTAMSYSVVVRRVRGLQIVCEAQSGVFTYRTTSTLPDDIDMAWWAPGDARCVEGLLPPGEFVMETCWTAPNPFVVLPPKTACRTSNVFSILP